jgi:hypothetical protein
VGQWYGGSEMLNRLAATHEECPQVREEVLLSVVAEALNKLLATVRFELRESFLEKLSRLIKIDISPKDLTNLFPPGT